MTNTIHNVPRELKPCPFCGGTPELPNGDGTQYEIECGGCGQAMASVQICDLMTLEERVADAFTDYRYGEEFVERAKVQAIEHWNSRAPSPAGVDGLEVVGVRVTSDGFGSYIADSAMGIPKALQGEVREPLCRLSSASSIIIGLLEKIERLQFSLEVAKTDELSAAVYAETESIKHSLWAAEKERDQQAQRIGELASHLEFAVTMLTVAGLAGNAQVEAMRSALSAGVGRVK